MRDLTVLPKWIDPYVAQNCLHRWPSQNAPLRPCCDSFASSSRTRSYLLPGLPSSTPHMNLVEDYLQRLARTPRTVPQQPDVKAIAMSGPFMLWCALGHLWFAWHRSGSPRLDDLDWHRELLHVRRRKAGNDTTYPLSVPVGEAILAYLRQGTSLEDASRTLFECQCTFFTLDAGWRFERSGAGVSGQSGDSRCAVGRIRFAIPVPSGCLKIITPLKTIGDFLGHRDLRTTQHYTMITLDQLREVARDGEDLS